MMVVSLQRHRNRRVVAVVKELLALADDGDLHSLAFVAKLGRKDHRAGVVGDYEDHPTEAVYAAARLKHQLLHEDDE